MKAIKIIGLTLTLMLMIVASMVTAQDIPTLVSSDIVNVDGRSNYPQLYQDDEIYLEQAGYSNRASIAQFSPAQNGNSAIVYQYGVQSNVGLHQTGNSNDAHFQQYGLMNFIDVKEQGDFISSSIYQVGYDNKVNQELGSDGMNYTIIQMGNKHEVIDRGFNLNNPGYTIKQSGLVGMKVTIQHH
jgi:hypothetical protein